MYNKEISEKIVSDAFDMMDNIRESKRVCKDIIGRNKVSDEYLELYKEIESIDKTTQKMVSMIVDINGGVKGYDTETYFLLITLYQTIIHDNMEVNTIRNKIRDKYM